MNIRQKRVHEMTVQSSKRYHRAEWELIQNLQEVEILRVHRAAGKASVFAYAVDILKLDEAIAYNLIALSRKSKEVPELRQALEERRITASKAGRILSILDAENAEELVQFASTHSKREIENEIARRNPGQRMPDRVKPISEDLIQITVTVTKSEYDRIRRAQSLAARMKSKITEGETMMAAIDLYIDRNDPVKKAERAVAREAKRSRGSEEASNSVNERTSSVGRSPLTAVQKHSVFARDKGRCTHVGLDGVRCDSDRWVEIHHIVPVEKGGSNDPDNLTTLCSFHHELIHQLSLGVDGGYNWISP